MLCHKGEMCALTCLLCVRGGLDAGMAAGGVALESVWDVVWQRLMQQYAEIEKQISRGR